jgi:hypothetical protein
VRENGASVNKIKMLFANSVCSFIKAKTDLLVKVDLPQQGTDGLKMKTAEMQNVKDDFAGAFKVCYCL